MLMGMIITLINYTQFQNFLKPPSLLIMSNDNIVTLNGFINKIAIYKQSRKQVGKLTIYFFLSIPS